MKNINSVSIEYYRLECINNHGTDVKLCQDNHCNVIEREYIVTGHVHPMIYAVTSGPPDNWSPAEGGEVEIVEILLNGKSVDFDTFSEKEFLLFEDKLFTAFDANDYDNADDDYDDADDDYWRNQDCE